VPAAPDAESYVHPIDLGQELALLRSEFPARGTVLAFAEDRGRRLSLHVATGDYAHWIQATSRLIGSPQQGVLDRIADAVHARSPERVTEG